MTRGPHLQIVASCHGCDHVKFRPSTGQRYSFTDCDHPEAPRLPRLEVTPIGINSTPQWCPLLKVALDEFTRGNPQHKVNGGD